MVETTKTGAQANSMQILFVPIQRQTQISVLCNIIKLNKWHKFKSSTSWCVQKIWETGLLCSKEFHFARQS
jgi:hypothetical protein